MTKYTWDHRNRLVKVTHYAEEGQGADLVVQYAYDHENRWVRKIVDPGGQDEEKTIFVYDGNQIALRFHDEGSGELGAEDLTNRYFWGPAVDQILADEQVHWDDTPGQERYVTDELLWPLGDHLGSVRDVIDGSGTVKIHRVYDAFGNFTEDPATASHLFAFTARPFDAATGLQNNLHRWYDPAPGRWLSEDPIGFEGDDVNLYRYGWNRPILYRDPRGFKATGTFEVKLKSIFSVAPMPKEAIFSSSATIKWNPPEYMLDWSKQPKTDPCFCQHVRLFQIAITKRQLVRETKTWWWFGNKTVEMRWELDDWHMDDTLTGKLLLVDWVKGAAAYDEALAKEGPVSCGVFAYERDDFGHSTEYLGRGWRVDELYQEFETCAVCIDSRSGHDWEVFGCVTWGHFAFRDKTLEKKLLWIKDPFQKSKAVTSNDHPALEAGPGPGAKPTDRFIHIFEQLGLEFSW